MSAPRKVRTTETRVAVVGGGIFGCLAAVAIADRGHRVALFERGRQLMQGATANNQNRLNLGYHYPRDEATIPQHRDGFTEFVQAFPECQLPAYPNGYFIAAEGTRTSPEDFLSFLQRNNLAYQPIAPDFPVQVQRCALGVVTPEASYDPLKLKRAAEALLRGRPRVEVRRRAHVEAMCRRGSKWSLAVRGGAEHQFDVVVNCSYADINRLGASADLPVRTYRYDYTVVPVIRCESPPAGITVLDGPFFSLLPTRRRREFLLYHVRHSVHESLVGVAMPAGWEDANTAPFRDTETEGLWRRFRDAVVEFVPAVGAAQLVGIRQSPRVVPYGVDATDARPSYIDDHKNGYLTVFSGKVVHAVPLSRQLANIAHDFLST